MSALRTKKGLSARDVGGLDAVDLALIEGVEADLPMQMSLRSAACSEEEAYGRLLRLIARGLLEELAGRSLREPARELNVGATTGIRTRPAREIAPTARRLPPLGSTDHKSSRDALPPVREPARAPARQSALRGALAVREELPANARRDARTLDSLPPAEKPEPSSRNIAAPARAIQRALSVTMVDDSSSELAQEHIARRSLPPATQRRPVRSPHPSEGRLDRSRTLEWTPQRMSAEPEEWPVPLASTSERPKAPARMGLGSEPAEAPGPLNKHPTGTVVGIGPPSARAPRNR